MLKLVKNCVLLFGILAIILIFGSIVYFNEAIYSWLDFSDSEKYSVSTYYEIIRNISLGISAGMGILLALWRIIILNDQTKIENGKLSLETEKIKFDMQAKTLAKIWSYVIDLNVNNAKGLSLYQNPIDLSQYEDVKLKEFFEKMELSEKQVEAILKGSKDDRKNLYIFYKGRNLESDFFTLYREFRSTYTKNKILLFPEIAKQLDDFDKEMANLTHYYRNNLQYYLENGLKEYKEITQKIEELCEKTEELCNETEKIIQDFLFSHISNSKNK